MGAGSDAGPHFRLGACIGATQRFILAIFLNLLGFSRADMVGGSGLARWGLRMDAKAWASALLRSLVGLLAAGSAIGGLAAPPAAPAAPLVFSNGKAAPWALVERNGEEWCQVRSPIKGASPYNFAELSPSFGNRTMEVRLIGPPTGEPAGSFEVAYQISDSRAAKITGGTADSAGHRTISLRFQQTEAARLYRGETLAIAPNGAAVYIIETSRFAARLPAWEACERRWLVARGADPAMVANAVTMPEGEMLTFFSWEDYPKSALIAGKSGMVEVLAIIGPSGGVTKCTILSSSKSAELDQATCSIIRLRAKFKPALDRTGHPVEGPVVTRVGWKIQR